MDIVELILSDHHEQRRMFAMLDELFAGEAEALTAVWRRLRVLLEVHAEAEEQFFYPKLLAAGTGAGSKDSAEAETDDAIGDHNDIRNAIADVEGEGVGTPAWWEAIAKVRQANSDHMGEEEREALADFRRHADLGMRHEIGLRFAVFEAAHAQGVSARDKDPADYIERNRDKNT